MLNSLLTRLKINLSYLELFYNCYYYFFSTGILTLKLFNCLYFCHILLIIKNKRHEQIVLMALYKCNIIIIVVGPVFKLQ